MSSTVGPASDQIGALQLRQVMTDIGQKRAAYLCEDQGWGSEPFKFVPRAITSGSALMGAGLALGAFLSQHR